jgi:hypothetical protein
VSLRFSAGTVGAYLTVVRKIGGLLGEAGEVNDIFAFGVNIQELNPGSKMIH